MLTILAFVLPLVAVQATPRVREAHAPVVIYLHGRIIEEQGANAVSPEFGPYAFRAIVDSLRAGGATVLADLRPAGTDMDRYAARVAGQVDSLIRAGVPARRITVVGFSKGGLIAVLASARVQRPDVRFVFLAGCNTELGSSTGPRVGGRIRSVIEASDSLASSCRPLFARARAGTVYDEYLLHTGLKHGTFYQPRAEWLGLVRSWVYGGTAAGSPPVAPAAGEGRSLLNGKDLAGWHVDVPAAPNVRVRNPFVVQGARLSVLGEPPGHLITDSVFRDYRLVAEYRFPGKPGNAGILVHASTPRALYTMFPKSIEVQMEHGNAGDFWCIVEDITVPNMERRRGPRAQWGITEGKGRRIANLTDGTERPLGQWNRMVIEAVGRSIKVWVNGVLVNHGTNATADRGHIAIQSEGSAVEFRLLQLTPVGPKP